MAEGKGVVVAGCVPRGDRGLVKRKPGKAPPLLDGVSSIGVKQLGRVGEAVAASLRGEVFHALGQGPPPFPRTARTTQGSLGGDRTFIHGVSGRVHLLQDAARAASSAPTRRRPSRNDLPSIGRASPRSAALVRRHGRLRY